MKNSILITLVIISLSIFSSCKTKKRAGAIPVDIQTVQKYWESQFDSEYVEARGKASITSNGKTNNVSMHLRMKKDSIIWGKFSLFGIGATVLINKDSFFMFNTLSQEYMIYDNSYLNQFLGFKATISQLQNLLLGNAIFPQTDYDFKPAVNQLIGDEGMATNTITINSDLRTLNSNISTSDTTQNADIQYDEYGEVNKKLMPKIVSIDVKKGLQKLDVVLNYQNINTNSITTFPFKIPNGFVRK
jgi:hypothetical protein